MDFIRYSIIFLLLATLQVVLLNNIGLFDLGHPVVYYWVILLLPVMPSWLLMLTAFGVGISMDYFAMTPGVNAAACVLLAYVRDRMILSIKPVDENDLYSAHIYHLGFSGYLIFIILISLMFHFMHTFLSVFTFEELFYTILRVCVQTILSVVLILIFEVFFFFRRQYK